MKLFNGKKGFTLVELLLTIGVMAVLTAVIYSYMSKKQMVTQADAQVTEILEMDTSIQQLMANVPVDNVLGVAKITQMLTPIKMIEEKIIPAGRASGNEIRNIFKNGTITFTAEALNVSSIGTRIVPVYSYNITEIPAAACTYIVSNFDLQTFVRIKVNGVTIKNPGETVSPLVASNACRDSTNTTIQITQSSVVNKPEHGTDIAVETTNGNLRNTENALFQEQLRNTPATSGGSCGAGSWNNTLSFCSCPVNTEWNGKTCIAMGQPGICPSGQGWSIANNVCEVLTKAPFAPNDAVYTDGHYVPAYAGSTAMPTGLGVGTNIWQCQGTLPPNASEPSNVGGNYDGSICNKCINGTWNGARCVMEYVK